MFGFGRKSKPYSRSKMVDHLFEVLGDLADPEAELDALNRMVSYKLEQFRKLRASLDQCTNGPKERAAMMAMVAKARELEPVAPEDFLDGEPDAISEIAK